MTEISNEVPQKVWNEEGQEVVRPNLYKIEKHFNLLQCSIHNQKEPCVKCLEDAKNLASKIEVPIYFTGKAAFRISYDVNVRQLPDLSGLDLKQRDSVKYNKIVEIAKFKPWYERLWHYFKGTKGDAILSDKEIQRT